MNIHICQKSLQLAIDLFPSIYGRQKNYHICCAYRKSRLISIGINNMVDESPKAIYFARRFKTGKMYPHNCGEIACLSRLWGRYHIDSSISLVVIRLSKHGGQIVVGESRPCKHCQIVIGGLGLNKVFYTTRNGWRQL